MTKRQRDHAAKMRARRGKRPWDEVHKHEAQVYIIRLRKLFEMGMSDEFIADALSMDKELVQILRTAKGRIHRRRPMAK
jgi:hypothetical protein